jgi:shikimate 5-dehydrogenase
MFIRQAALQFEMWTGRTLPEQVIMHAWRKA